MSCVSGKGLVQKMKNETAQRKARKGRKPAPRGSVLRAMINERRQPHQDHDPCRLLRINELSVLLSVHPQTLWRWSRDGRLPKPIKISAGVTAWRSVDVERWLSAKAEAND
jgi:predicted DNA-binding transcriptional regulator AlpA